MSAKGSELKRVRQNIKARSRNKSYLSKMNTVSKRVLATNKKDNATKELTSAIKTIDKQKTLITGSFYCVSEARKIMKMEGSEES